MAFIRVKKRGNKDYYYLVENSRIGNQVKQTCLKYLGTTKPDKEEFERIIRNIKSGR
jgi:hypothetical protein